MIGPAGLAALALVAAGLGVLAGMELGDLRALYEACAGRVMSVALHLLRDPAEAEDVVQETFLELWRRPAGWDPARGSREAYAVLMGRSRALDRLRARSSARRAAERVPNDPVISPAAPLELAEQRQRRERVARALDALPPPQRQAIQLAYFGGLSETEIAARVGEPLGTVKTRLRLAMDKLAEHLAEDAP